MSDELVLLEDALDQPVPMDELLGKVMKRVDAVVKTMDKDKHPQVALAAARTLLAAGRVSGLALAKLFFHMGRRWASLGMEETFEDMTYQELGVARETVHRYVLIWQMFEQAELDPEVRRALMRKPMRELYYIASFWRQSDHPVTKRQWKSLANSADLVETQDRVRKLMGKAPRVDAMNLSMEKDGSLVAYQGRRKSFYGYLNIKEEDELCIKAIHRTIRGAGIRERN